MPITVDREVFARLSSFSPATNQFASKLIARGLEVEVAERRSAASDKYVIVKRDGEQLFNLHSNHVYVTREELQATAQGVEGVEPKSRGVRALLSNGSAQRVVDALLA